MQLVDFDPAANGVTRCLPRSKRSKLTSAIRAAGLVAGVLLLVAPAGAAEKGVPFEFAMIGDYPYFDRDDASMPFLLADLSAAPHLSWILHLGDLHNPRATACSEALLRERRDWFIDLGHPFVFTPGDNDWADCGGDPEEHLETLRRVFFHDPSTSLGKSPFPVRSQSTGADFPDVVENAIWEREGVVFATLHLISHRKSGFLDSEHELKRHLVAAGTAWLDEAFRVAEENDAKGVFLATQVDIWPTSGNVQIFHVFDPSLMEQRPELAEWRARLVERTRAFARPVVLANGDTHVYRVDKPLFDEEREVLQNFTRVEGFGSPQGHWVRVRVEPDREEVFSFRQEWVAENMFSLVPHAERTDSYSDHGPGLLLIPIRLIQWAPTVLAIIGAASVARFARRVLVAWHGKRPAKISR